MTDIDFPAPGEDEDDGPRVLEVLALGEGDNLAAELAEIVSSHPSPPPVCIRCGHIHNAPRMVIIDCACRCHESWRFVHRVTRMPEGRPPLPGE
jgi:hypothetical protein